MEPIQGLKTDTDPRFRQEVEQALTSLASSAPPGPLPAVQPVQAINP